MQSPQDSQISVLIQQAINLHVQGKFGEALALYQQILAIEGRHFDALHLTGAVYLQTHHFETAIDWFARALQINPLHVACHSNLGLAFKEVGRLNDAMLMLDQALRLDPGFLDAHLNRAQTLLALGRLEEALVSCDHAVQISPNSERTHFNRAYTLFQLRRLDEAIESYDQAIRCKPNYAQAHSNRGLVLHELKRFEEALPHYNQAIQLKPDYAEAYCNRANTLLMLKRLDEAMADYDRAVDLKPESAEIHCNRGTGLKYLKRLPEALASYDRALALNPNYPQAHCNRGAVLQELNRPDEAMQGFDRAIALKQDYAEAYSNKGFALQILKRFDESLAAFNQAIQITPDYADAHWNLSLCHLLLGNTEAGWLGYEWRWQRDSFTSPKRGFSQPLWLGAQSLNGKTILLHAEQGFGDTIQFSRYVPMVAALGARVILEVQATLKRLLSNLEGADVVLARGEPLPDFDYHCPLMSLALAFKTTLTSIPATSLAIDVSDRDRQREREHWQGRLPSTQKKRIGLIWSGSPIHDNDRNRSLSLSKLISHLPPGFEYVSLQKEVSEHDALVLEEHHDIRHFGGELNDFADTTALCQLMDLVISIDSGVAHLAGTLGRPTWLLLPYNPDWRWLLEGADTPWYPRHRLFRQTSPNDWDSVLRDVNVHLKNSRGIDEK